VKTEGGVIERAMVEWRIVVTLVVILVALGGWALLTMPRQEFPEFTIRQGLVVGVMPGATSTEVAEQLAKPVEEYLAGFQEVDKTKTYSVSSEGQVVVFVELRESVKGGDAPAFWAKLRHGLPELKAQRLPARVLALVGNNDFGDTSALLVTVVGKGQSPRDLEHHLEILEARLRALDATSKLRRTGLQGEVIRVTLDRERLTVYGVRPATVWAAVQGLGAAPAAARVDTDTLELPVHVGRVLRSEKELAEAILLSDPAGAHVRLGDVATIVREYGHDESTVRYDGEAAVVLSIEMQTGNDITRYGKQVDEIIAGVSRELPPNVKIARIADQPRAVRTSVNHFLRDFGLAIASVIAVTMLLLPLRVAAVAAVTIPVSVLITLAVLNALGVQLQTVSLAGLVVVLGMVVDNAIVVVDDHVERLDHGEAPWSAAWRATRELALPIFTATLAIVMAYLPFNWFLGGMAGDFVSSLPVTVGVALGASLLVALFLVPTMCAAFIRTGLNRPSAEAGKPTVLERMQAVYDRALELAFAHPRWTFAGAAASVAIAVALALHVPQQLFPKVDRDQFAIEVYLPVGRTLGETDQVVGTLERQLASDARVRNVTSFVGTSSPRFHTVYAPVLPSRTYAQLIVNTTSEEATLEVIAEGERRTANAFPQGWVRWKQLDMQATTAPIEVRLSGNDPRALHAAAARVEALARAVPGATWVRNDWGEPVQGIGVEPDADACARLGLSPSMLQASLAVGSRQGVPVGTIWEGDYPVRVLLADDPRVPATLEQFRQQSVSSPFLAAAVPLEQVAKVKPEWAEATVVRRNGVPTLTVRVDVARGVLASTVQAALERDLARQAPLDGVRLTWGGEKEEQLRYFVPLGVSLLTSVVAIYLVLLFQFRRHRKALVVMMTMPLSLLGAFLGLAVFGFPFGLTAFLGVISLMGIVVRNGIILVGYAEELRESKGLGVREAALAAGRRRMRPIFLTSAAAAVGVIPLITSGSTLWGPLGAVIFGGLLLAMVLALLVLPVAYATMVREEGVAGHGAAMVAAAALLAVALPGPALAQEGGPLTLERARELARRQGAEVLRSEAEVRAAEQTRAGAFTGYVPQVSASGQALRASSALATVSIPGGNLPVIDPATGTMTGDAAYFPGGRFDVAEHLTFASVTALQPVFAGGRVVNGNRLAAVGVRVAEEQLAIARRDAAIGAEERYWRHASLREKERTLASYEALLEALERQAAEAVAAGLATRNDLLAVQVKRQEAAVDRLRVESGLRLSARDLRRHVGLPEGDAVELADPTPPAPGAAPAAAAAARRPELRLLERALEAEGLKKQLALGEGLPTLAVGASLMHFDVSGMGKSDEAVVFATVNVPLTGLWKSLHDRSSAAEHEQAARIRLEDTRALLAMDAARARDALETEARAVQAADAGVEQARVNLDEKRSQHGSGLVTLSDVLEAQVLLHRAEDRRIDARVDWALARAGYERAIGGE